MFDYKRIFSLASDILAIPSPSGYTKDVIDFLVKLCEEQGFAYERMNNGSLVVSIKGETDYTVGLGAHVDTLGAMVCAINGDGTLKFDRIGGPVLPTYDGEYCEVITREGKKYTGTFLCKAQAAHVHKGSGTMERNTDTMIVRLDEVVHSKDDVKKLGICNGDYIALDPKTTVTPSGYIKSRFLDDKLSVAIIFELLKHLKEENITPKYNLKVIISTFEEVGFGSSYIPKIDEFLAVDMGCVGEHLEGSEEKVSICAKDSGGPYNYEMNTKLINIAKELKLDYAVDIFPYYSSDVTAALKAGHNIKGSLIGSGVAASHGMERTHLKGIINTFELVKGYVLK